MTVEPSEEPSLCQLEDHSSDEEATEAVDIEESLEANEILDIEEAEEAEEANEDSDEKPLETALTEFYAD